MLNQSSQNTRLSINGDRLSGKDAQKNNIAAALFVADALRTSLGPNGLDKMLVDKLGEITISNDGATILKKMELIHPAAQMLAELARKQDADVGDGTTSVVVLAAELLRHAGDMLRTHALHPATVIAGYRAACKAALRHVEDTMCIHADALAENTLLMAAKTALASKLVGGTDHFAQIAVDAALAVKRTENGITTCPVDKISILKARGKAQSESTCVDGYLLNCTPASHAMPRKITDAWIVCLDMDLQKIKMKLGISVVVDNPENLEEIRAREAEITLERCQKIVAAGANVVLTTKGIDDMALKVFVEAGVIAVRRCKKRDLLEIARATGTALVQSLSTLDGDEKLETPPGYAEAVSIEAFGDNECILVTRPRNAGAAAVLLRGANEYMLEEMHRALHDALCITRRLVEAGSIVPGAGAVEADVALRLSALAETLDTKEQMPIERFAIALETIPKTLAENAAQDPLALVAMLNAAHADGKKNHGLDLVAGGVHDAVAAGIIEPAAVKLSALKSATEVAIALLRIDDVVTVHPKQQPSE